MDLGRRQGARKPVIVISPRDDRYPVHVEWLRALRPNWLWAREFLLACLVLSIYAAVNLGSADRREAALDNCEAIIRAERALGIFMEVEIQGMVLGTPGVPLLSYLYAFVHPLLTVAFIAVAFLSRRTYYPGARNAFVVFSLISFAVFLVFPSAPPRMMTEYGFVDLLHEEAPVSYEMELARKIFNPYAAMPSIHFGYSLIVGLTLLLKTDRIPLRLLGIAYPALMLLSVTASANHLLLDCIASAGLLLLTYILVFRLGLIDRLTRIFQERAKRTDSS